MFCYHDNEYTRYYDEDEGYYYNTDEYQVSKEWTIYNAKTQQRLTLPEESESIYKFNNKYMKYAIYFTWKDDGFEDSFNVDSAKERDLNIREMIKRNEFKEISFCPIYASGEYGQDHRVL